jgi:predicted O-linked N-acetylglucosamine transferase (SPINDLY family)
MPLSNSPRALDATQLDELCREAMKLQIAGRLDLAEQTYRRILEAESAHASANHCFGMLKVQQRHPTDGLPYLLAALRLNPEIPDYWLGYLEALMLAGRTDDAEETLALGVQHGLTGATVEDFARRLSTRLPTPNAAASPAPATSPPLASPAPSVGQAPASPVPPIAQALASRADRRRAARLAPKQESAMLATLKQGDTAAALAQARALTETYPERGVGWKVFGALLWAETPSDGALVALQTAARLMPEDAESHTNLGATLIKLERLDEAEACLARAVALDPRFAAAHVHLGDVYQLQGRYTEAWANVGRAIELKADDKMLYSSLLFMLCHNPTLDADSLFAEHCRVGELIETPLRASRPQHSNSRDPNRRLKVGFVSGDLRNHAVANFFEPVLAQLCGRPELELHAYCTNIAEDRVSERLRGYLTGWHRVSALSDGELARKIMDDQIDILIDLSGHTSLNRLHTFARKPAPIQASWIGYPGTTGLLAMDYFLADRHFLPADQFARYFTEKLVYLPAQVPFQPYEAAPPVNALPALATGCITFGSFNRVGKITALTVDLWSQLLRAVPAAKMLIAGTLANGPPNGLLEQFTTAGIDAERLSFHPRCGMDAYLALHHQVDICLDTYPYAGGTTTVHALWMGVPTLTLAGPTSAARSGAAILGQIGLHEFIATDVGEFVAKGLYWANHLAELAQLREGLRDRWQQSPGRRADVIATALEAALRRMWQRWCANLPAESFEIPIAES